MIVTTTLVYLLVLGPQERGVIRGLLVRFRAGFPMWASRA